jgi:integrase
MAVEKCHVIDVRPSAYTTLYNFDSLIPQAECDDIEAVAEYAAKQRQSQGMDCLPLDLYNQMLENCLENGQYRSAFWITAMANFGLRHSDVTKFRRIDLIDEHNKFRDQILLHEKKTSRQRVVFINKAVKMALLMHLWHSDITPMDFLIASQGRRKGYELEIGADGKAKREKGKYIYKLDDHGNKIPKPLTISMSEKIMKNIIIENIGIALKNDKRTKDDPDCIGKICTHSLRKLYGWGIEQYFINQFDSDIAYAHAAALQFLSLDYGHSSVDMTLHYSKDHERQKREIVMNMNLGLPVLEKYFEKEYALRIGGVDIGKVQS